MVVKTALITGVNGQDGSYLAEFLLEKGYIVHGIVRRASSFNTQRIEHLYSDPHDPDARLFLHYGDMTDGAGLRRIVSECKPDEVYNLAAQSHVGVSFVQPVYTTEVDAVGTIRLLEAIRDLGLPTRFYQASTSEIYGNSPSPQSESTPVAPRSPYACAKAHAYWATINYREAYGMFACNGILFNHESPRRGETFVTRKITRAAGRIVLHLQDKLYLGNMDACRDWGFAGDYVEAMWLMLQQEQPDDFVIATGETHSVAEFADLTFGWHDLEWQKYVIPDKRYERPTEVDALCGDSSKARRVLEWKPKVGFKQLVAMMVESDWRLARREKAMAIV